jgi:RNA polymerase sigma factor (sigma-70 family)
MKITNKQINRYKVQAMVIANENHYYADEILSKVMQKIMKKMEATPEFVLTDNFVFISLRNAYIDMLRAEKVQNNKKTFLIHKDEYETDIEELKEVHRVKDNKLNAITKTYDEVLNSFEQKLYYLHFVRALSQRQISRDTGIGLMTINNRINKIKTKIREYYAKNYQE